jgi:hypothetical protein
VSDNPYTDDEYDDTYKKVHGDDPARDQYAEDETTDDIFFPSGASNSLSPLGWGIWPGGDTADATAEGNYDKTGYEGRAATGDEDGSWWDVGLIGGLLLVGIALFLFPEPGTSAIGIGLIALGVIAWVVDWLA